MYAVAYYRVSGLGQKYGDGIPRQEAAVKEVCKLHNLTLLHEYKDVGRTGDLGEHGLFGIEDLSHREQFVQLLLDLQAKKWGEDVTLVFEQVSRLARWQPLQEVLVCEIAKTGAKITSKIEGPGLETTDPTKVFIRQILGAVSQLDKSQIVDKLRKARNRNKAAGKRQEGQIAYGRHPKHPEEIEILSTILELQSSGLTCGQVADILNDRGVRTRKGKKWGSGTVCKIMKREAKRRARELVA